MDFFLFLLAIVPLISISRDYWTYDERLARWKERQ